MHPRFVKRPWPEVREFLAAMEAAHQRFRYMVDVVDSVFNSGVSDRLAATTSMHDLLVVLAPIGEPPLSIIIVRAPGSLARPRHGEVIIEHRAPDGAIEKIARPVAEAVPLFWRFVSEKFGLHAARSTP